ncbi:hypothetical protein [Candidatus Thiodictyon syntrophicum]|jgi:hypothetical protein|uniref:hypothetical protein n=1 Tax=Candidatus Thiodictyon syntrophicum TaxID=1166950 RepID=UPI0012FDF2FC|nr:hypothetical protein [Candidatus Thiodictyon syntrophicum]
MQRYTHDEIWFEIPREIESRLARLLPAQIKYVCNDAEATAVPLRKLTSPKRDSGVKWFDVERMSCILDGLESGSALPPIELHRHPNTKRLLVRDGFHRYYLSTAAGLSDIPCREYPYFDIRETQLPN